MDFIPNDGTIWVSVQLYGLGKPQTVPEAMVLILAPTEEDSVLVPGKGKMLLPIPVSPHDAPIFARMLTRKHRSPHVTDRDMTYYLEQMSGCRLQALLISRVEIGLRSRLFYLDKEGFYRQIDAPLASGVLTAILHDVTLLVDQSLLIDAGSTIRFNQEMTVGNKIGSKVKQHTLYEIISREIERGKKPEKSHAFHELLPDDLTLTEQERESLLDRAIEREQYEWALVIKSLGGGVSNE